MSNIPILHNDFCSGCGVCVAVCPVSAIEMSLDKYGELKPTATVNKCTECGLCKTCYFYAEKTKSSCTQKTDLPGDIIQCFVGGVNNADDRSKTHSGGMATWILRQILEQNIVDYVICVTTNNNKFSLFSYTIVNDSADIKKSAGSKYVQVSADQVVRHILNHSGRYVIIGLPCLIQTLHAARKKIPKLKERLFFLLGLTCLHNKTNFFNSHISSFFKSSSHNVNIIYRYKCGRTPLPPVIKIEDENNAKVWLPEDPVNRHIWSVFSNASFGIKACNCCDDVFAEYSDASFMDAWLPAYKNKPEGNSIVIVRNPLINEIILDGIKKAEISLAIISSADAKGSQTAAIHKKTKVLSRYLYYYPKKGLILPERKVTPQKPSQGELIEIILQETLRAVSGRCYAKIKKQGHFLFLYRNIFLFYFWLHERYFQLRNIFRTIVQKVYK